MVAYSFVVVYELLIKQKLNFNRSRLLFSFTVI